MSFARERHVRRADVLLEIARRFVPGIGTMSWPLCSSHASAICAGVAPFRSRDLTHGRRGAHVRVEILALIARIAAAEVAFRILLGALHRAGEKSAAERRERDETDAELAQQRE